MTIIIPVSTHDILVIVTIHAKYGQSDSQIIKYAPKEESFPSFLSSTLVSQTGIL